MFVFLTDTQHVVSIGQSWDLINEVKHVLSAQISSVDASFLFIEGRTHSWFSKDFGTTIHQVMLDEE